MIRQQGKRPLIGKTLVSHAVAALLEGEGGYQSALVVIVAVALQAGQAVGEVATFGENHPIGGEMVAVAVLF